MVVMNSYKKGGKVPAMKRNQKGACMKEGGACMKKGGDVDGKFIQGMHLKKGALHRSLGVPMGKKIPDAKIKKAEHSSNKKLAARARAAEMLKGLRHK